MEVLTKNSSNSSSLSPQLQGYDRDNLVKYGKSKRLDNMRRRLSRFFSLTRLDPDYALNWSSPGKYVPMLITLTYRSNDQWEPKQISIFINHLRMYAKRKWGGKLRYVWVAENQKRGVIHYHIVGWHPRKIRFPKPSEAGWWPYGRSKIEGVRKSVYTYILKYITKSTEDLKLSYKNKTGKEIKVRIFACGGLEKNDREFLTYYMLPSYVKHFFGPIPFGENPRRIKGGWRYRHIFLKSCYDSFFDKETFTFYFEKKAGCYCKTGVVDFASLSLKDENLDFVPDYIINPPPTEDELLDKMIERYEREMSRDTFVR